MRRRYVWSGSELARATGKSLAFTDTGVSLRRGVTVATPDLNGFERSADGETWAPCGAAWSWNPADEGSHLLVRSINRAGRPGVASSVDLRADESETD